ncbi:xanthine dehydrogenase small subunit [Rhodococcus sp. GA1]|uniref:xanthine dehydrogenase small subunit n=1 Tax=Rhodococcus sp. GA1 TaxID=2942275 RepID=UPI0020CD8D06|nr:FAD binding domain-containing protein [Rhodococcus sp. GA1]
MNALDWIRQRGLTGAKEGCAEGECGACAILLARPGVAAPTEWVAVNACLMPAQALTGQEVVTAEGLGTPDDLHPVQNELAIKGGSQCGYCTPGFVCSMAAEYYRPDRGEDFDIHALSGNLCRCTGYRPIRDAANSIGSVDDNDPLTSRRLDPPPALVATRFADYIRVGDLSEALVMIAADPSARPVAGSTDVAVEANIGGARPALRIGIGHLEELRHLLVDDDHVEIGAALTLSEIERRLDGTVPLLAQLIPQFASRLIRNAATIGGNLGTGSPIGDMAPALLALDAEVELVSTEGRRIVPLADYFTGYRQSVRRSDELIVSVRIPRPLAGLTAFHKVAKRRFDDISSIAVALALDIEEGRVRRAAIGVGGVAATPIRARAAEAALLGKSWNEETVRAAAAVLSSEGTPLDDHRATAAYRSAMLGQALVKFHSELEGTRA